MNSINERLTTLQGHLSPLEDKDSIVNTNKWLKWKAFNVALDGLVIYLIGRKSTKWAKRFSVWCLFIHALSIIGFINVKRIEKESTFLEEPYEYTYGALEVAARRHAMNN